MATPVTDQHTFGFFQDNSADPDVCTQIGTDNSPDETGAGQRPVSAPFVDGAERWQ